mgnify:CR=1 FL=1
MNKKNINVKLILVLIIIKESIKILFEMPMYRKLLLIDKLLCV